MKHLEAWQRYEIAARLEAGFTKKQVAEFLHVHPSTITREIQRNGYSRYRVYRPKIAQERAEHRWRCRKLPRRFKEDVRVKGTRSAVIPERDAESSPTGLTYPRGRRS